MKNFDSFKGLRLNKKAIAILNDLEVRQVVGGALPTTKQSTNDCPSQSSRTPTLPGGPSNDPTGATDATTCVRSVCYC